LKSPRVHGGRPLPPNVTSTPRGFPVPPKPSADEMLLYSARNRDIKKLRKAIFLGGDPNASDDGDSSLHWAVFWGDKDLTQLLLEAGANPSLPNKFGRTAIEDAYRENKRHVAKLLELWKNKENSKVVRRGRDAVEFAVKTQQPSALRSFISDQRSNFLMEVHVDSATNELAKIVKKQDALCRKMTEASQAQDVGTLKELLQESRHMPGMSELPKVQELEEKLELLLEEEAALEQRLEAILAVEFADAHIERMAKELSLINASPLSRTLDLQPARAMLEANRSQREGMEARLTAAVDAVVESMVVDGKGKAPPIPSELLDAYSEVATELAQFKPLAVALEKARSTMAQIRSKDKKGK